VLGSRHVEDGSDPGADGLAILGARLAYDAPMVGARVGAAIDQLAAPAPLAPPLMYAGIRG
jgi:hypothetical protein